MIRIIFVGIHNKPNLEPLDGSTKTGKLINRIIALLPDGLKIVKSNLFNIDHFPDPNELRILSSEWYDSIIPTEKDIVILLGDMIHKQCKHEILNLIKLAHPSSQWSHKDMDKYVLKASEKIKLKLLLLKSHHMTELDLHSIGFECKKQYEHDQFYTNRYIKGVMEVEFTYLGPINSGGELQDISLSLTETDFENISFEEISLLNKILNKRA